QAPQAAEFPGTHRSLRQPGVRQYRQAQGRLVSGGFLGRWSRRKQASRLAGGPAPEPTPPAGAAPPAPPPAAAPDAGPVTAAPPPAPTLEEAQALTPADDFSR